MVDVIGLKVFADALEVVEPDQCQSLLFLKFLRGLSDLPVLLLSPPLLHLPLVDLSAPLNCRFYSNHIQENQYALHYSLDVFKEEDVLSNKVFLVVI